MNELSTVTLWIFTFTFLAAGLMKGVTGMGLPTVAMGILGTIMAPAAAAAILIVPSLVTNVWQLLDGPAMPRIARRLWPMMLSLVASTVFGTALLVRVDPAWTTLALGIALVLYAGYALISPELSLPVRWEPWLSPIIGLVTGIITGVTGVFAIPAVPYLQSLGLSKDELVQALGLSFTISTVALAAGLMMQGAFHLGQAGLSALAIVPSLAGMWLGQKIRARISPKTFRICFLLFLLLLGCELVSRSF